jgi:hypothetical protein
VQGGEDDGLAVVVPRLLVELVDVPPLLEVLVAKEEVADQQLLHGLHPDAARHLLLAVRHPVLVHLHHVVELLQHPGLVDGLGVLHLLHDGGVGQHLVEAVEVAVGALGEDDLVDPPVLGLVVLLLELGPDVAEELVVDEAGTGDDEALDAVEVERADDHVALLEELVERLAVDLVAGTLLGDVALDLLLEQRDGLLHVAQVRHALLHDHGRDLHPVLLPRDLLDQVDLVERPLLLVDGDLGLQLDLEGVELPDLQKLVLLGVPPLDADAQPVLLREVVYLDY